MTLQSMRKKRIISMSLIVVAIVVITAGVLYPFFQTPPNKTADKYTTVLMNAGNSAFLNPSPGQLNKTIYTGAYSTSIPDGGYIYENFTMPRFMSWAVVFGSFTSSGTIDAAVLTPSEFGSFQQNPSSINSGPYYSQTTGTSLNVSLGNGSYTFVFYNPSVVPLTAITLSIGSAITLMVATASSGFYSAVPFSVPPNASAAQIVGGYSANSTIEVAILTASMFENFTNRTSVISSGPFFSGGESTGQLSVALSQGSYYVVFYNPSIYNSAVVKITDPIELEIG